MTILPKKEQKQHVLFEKDLNINPLFIGLLFTVLFSFNLYASDDPFDIDALSEMTLEEILDIKVVTPSRIDQSIVNSSANISVVTAQTIQTRGYQNLYEVLQDIPGFDFATFEDGGGEYPNHSVNRGIGGTPGNPKLLIMIDGVVQNHIAFNWSLLFGEEQIFADLDRIEIVQGPASALYGANAFSGIIHFITHAQQQKKHTAHQVRIAQNNTHSYQGAYGGQSNNMHYYLAGKIFKSDGDNGIGRHDPAGYFNNNPYPTVSAADYDANRQYILNSPSPYAGQMLPDGFNTEQKSWSARGAIEYIRPKTLIKGIEQVKLSGFYWQKEQGLGSYVPGYEYQARHSSFQSKHSAKQLNFDYTYRLDQNMKLSGNIWYRQNRQHPTTGFKYTYRFVDLVKSYHSRSAQHGIEKRLNWQLSDNDTLQLGARFIASDKMNQIVSLGQYQSQQVAATSSSWQYATAGDNPSLGQQQQYSVNRPNEQALYFNYDSKVNEQWSFSGGLRADHSDDYDTTINPRFGIVYQVPNQMFKHWNFKLLYGEAFREPSSFELSDEFRGNSQLEPEQIKTVELISQIGWQGKAHHALQSLTLQGSLYYSDMSNLITLVPNPMREGGAIYDNSADALIKGGSIQIDGQINHNWSFYTNANYGQGKNGKGVNNNQWQDIPHTAAFKLNWGVNWQDDAGKYLVNLRQNYVGQRAVPTSNGFYNDHAPSYTITNLNIGIKPIDFSGLKFKPYLTIKNLFDKQFAGVGRQAGSSIAQDYHPTNNINPAGFIPGYHPQPGRTIALTLTIDFNDI